MWNGGSKTYESSNCSSSNPFTLIEAGCAAGRERESGESQTQSLLEVSVMFMEVTWKRKRRR